MDIKPENAFISFDGICKLGDFGLVIDLTKVRLAHFDNHILFGAIVFISYCLIGWLGFQIIINFNSVAL